MRKLLGWNLAGHNPRVPTVNRLTLSFRVMEYSRFSELQLWCVYYRSAPYLPTSHKKQVPIEYSLILSTEKDTGKASRKVLHPRKEYQ